MCVVDENGSAGAPRNLIAQFEEVLGQGFGAVHAPSIVVRGQRVTRTSNLGEIPRP